MGDDDGSRKEQLTDSGTAGATIAAVLLGVKLQR